MNRDKSEAVWIGASSNFRHKPFGLNWTAGHVKPLGLHIACDQDKIIRTNFEERLNKIENILDIWCLRKLTLNGIILIINTLILPQLLYTCTVLYTPAWVIKKYQKLIIKFIWDNKPS